jgi:hypothetical protein
MKRNKKIRGGSNIGPVETGKHLIFRRFPLVQKGDSSGTDSLYLLLLATPNAPLFSNNESFILRRTFIHGKSE